MSYFEPQKLQQTAFGELNTAELTPYIQIVPVYNLLPANFRAYTSGTGTAGVETKMFYAKTSTTAYDYGAIQSFRALNYRTGQGGLGRFTAIFETSAANSQQGVGFINLSDELSFGYNGTTFGIWHRYGGYAEVRTISVTGASGGSTDLTLTLNSVAYTIPLTSGTTAHNAYEIAEWLNANQSVWHADQVSSTVIISAKSDGAKSGTYSYSHATSTGTITQNTAGVTKTSDHIAQSSWNGDTCSWLDQTQGNVYQIKYQYLGFGGHKFYIEKPDTAEFILVHTIEYANANTSPSLTNPSMHLGLYAFNANVAMSTGSTTALTVRTASFLAASEGPEVPTRNTRAYSYTQTSVGTSFTNILTLRNRKTYNNLINQVEIEPKFLIVASESNKNSEFQLIGNPTVSGETNFTKIGSTELVIDVDTTKNTISGGRVLLSGVIGAGESLKLDLENLRIRIPPTLDVCVAVKNFGAAADVSAALTWYEDLS